MLVFSSIGVFIYTVCNGDLGQINTCRQVPLLEHLVAGQEEIESAARQARALAKEYQDRPKLQVFTLYAAQNMYVASVICLLF
jgi:hypothetical protein